MVQQTFEFRGETFTWFEDIQTVMASKGETIHFNSIDDFCLEAEAEDGAENLSDWEY